MRLLVSGGSGSLGWVAAQAAVDLGWDVTALWHSRALPEGFGGRAARVDLRDTAAVEELDGWGPWDWVLHTAAIADVDWCESNPEEAAEVNVGGTRVMARMAHRVGARLALVSSDGLFGEGGGPFAESDPPSPPNEYARQKLAAEVAAQSFARQPLILRGSFVGWSHRGEGILEWAAGRLRHGLPVPGFVDSWFNPLSTNGFVETGFELMKQGASGVFHLGTEDSLSKFEFLRMFAEAGGYAPELVEESSLASLRAVAQRPRSQVLATGKMSAALGRMAPSSKDVIARIWSEAPQGLRGANHDLRG